MPCAEHINKYNNERNHDKETIMCIYIYMNERKNNETNTQLYIYIYYNVMEKSPNKAECISLERHE